MLIGFGAIGAVLRFLAWRRTDATGSLATWRNDGSQIAAVGLWIIGAALFTLSMASPRLTKLVYVGWMSATVPIGVVMSTILLTMLFVFILPIFSLIVRMGDPLRRKLKTNGSYWEAYKRHEPTIERMRRPF